MPQSHVSSAGRACWSHLVDCSREEREGARKTACAVEYEGCRPMVPSRRQIMTPSPFRRELSGMPTDAAAGSVRTDARVSDVGGGAPAVNDYRPLDIATNEGS